MQSSREHLEIVAAFEQSVRETILTWYQHNARTFLWREQHGDISQPPDPYIVLVSEIMLQQTQTTRVEERLPIFLALFPDIHTLAAADTATILKAWEGMGYNSRALRLRDCARIIVEQHHGIIPRSVQELQRLPGIGTYTAAAIAAFAYHEDVVVLDVNIRRVYSRLLSAMPTTASVACERHIQAFAERIYPRGDSSRWHQAVMDLGALCCTARKPQCSICPLFELCPSAGTMKEQRKRRQRHEPSYYGIPNRIWRGRVIQILRGLQRSETITLVQLRTLLLSDYRKKACISSTDQQSKQFSDDDVWLLTLLQGLARDNMVDIQCSDTPSDSANDIAQYFVRLCHN
ncbi:MAG: hypothetical protein RML40_11120 [Bacteroidota bacterium]|nr:hypothetical protein [Candidatus Kapabacteria bacterium]MDW8221065.1 hypothetical protein [Bacteroidota bacterium]